jgi:DNA-binding MarR family transcriptional regulator
MTSGVLEGEDLEFWRSFLSWSQTVHASVNRALTETADLSVPEFEVLTRLWSDDGELPQLALTDDLGWSPSRASHLLTRLEGRELIRREDIGPRRARTVLLTESGRAFVTRAFDVHGRAFRDRLLDRLTPEQRSTLLGIMTAQPDHQPQGGTMPGTTASTARVTIERPDRFGKQLVNHLGRRFGGEWDAETGSGTIELQGGRATVTAQDGGLTLVVGAAEADLDRLEEIVASHLLRFADQPELTVTWTRIEEEAPR